MTIKFPLKRFTVLGNSMLPTLKPGQDVLILCWFYKQSLKNHFERLLSKFFYKLKVGDLVVFKKDNKEMVKRVQKIDGRRVFVIGDNGKESTDSRNFGWIDKKDIIGKVVFVV